jgi:membrane protein
LSTLIRIFVPVDSMIWSGAERVVSLPVFIAAFGGMYRMLPDAHIAWADAWRGALLTTVLFVAGKYAIDLYIRRASVGTAYGPAGALVVLLVWVYYASTIVLVGAELTHGLSLARGETVKPEPQAEHVESAKPD